MARKTIKDIAREAGYSTGTVSRVLNGTGPVSDAAHNKIMEVVNRHHFQLNTNAKYLRQTMPSGIAIIVKGTNNLLFTSLVELLQKRTEEAGYNVSLFYLQEYDNEVEAAADICVRRNPEGILFLGSSRDNFRKSFHKVPVPAVMVTNSASGLDFCNLGSVSTNDSGAAQFAVETLLAAGHRKIGILGGDISRSQAAKSRFQGLQYAFLDFQADLDVNRQYEKCLFSIEDGARGMLALLDRMPDMTAVFAMADVMAVGAVRACVDRGLKVPEDISVIGFDGIELSGYTVPRLTTIRQDQELLACQSVEMLVRMIESGEDGQYLEVPHDLYLGESLSPCKGW